MFGLPEEVKVEKVKLKPEERSKQKNRVFKCSSCNEEKHQQWHKSLKKDGSG